MLQFESIYVSCIHDYLSFYMYFLFSLRNAGQVGLMYCNIRTAAEAQLGSTVHRSRDIVTPLKGFPSSHPMVYAGLYPVDQSQFQALRIALDKLLINDSGVTIETETRYAHSEYYRYLFSQSSVFVNL